MSDGLLLLLAFYGFACVATLGRITIAFTSEQRMLRPLIWMWLTFGLAVYVEIKSPIGATFDAVMLGLIHVAAIFV